MFSRLQLQGELQSKKDAPRMYRGVFHGVSVILKNEGPKGLFRGIGAAVWFFGSLSFISAADDISSMCTRWSSTDVA